MRLIAVHLVQGLPQNYLNAKILLSFKISQNDSALRSGETALLDEAATRQANSRLHQIKILQLPY
jgi:hypothetical protein